MEIIIAKFCGLCAGCQNALNKTLMALKGKKDVVLFKELVHNDSANKMLFDNGATLINNLNKLKPNQTIILRAHGEPPNTYKYLDEQKIEYIDCTCTRVKEVHNIAKQYSENGFTIVLIGKNSHPEVLGTIGYITGKYLLINKEDDLTSLKLSPNEKICVIYQTTFNEKSATELTKIIEDYCKQNKHEIVVKNTICPVQKQINICATRLAKTCDFMIVVGNKNSSNTQELFNNLSKIIKTIFVNDIYNWKADLSHEGIILNTNSRIGITAGASTLKEDLVKLKYMILQSPI